DLGGAWARAHPSSANALSRAYLGQDAGSCVTKEDPAGAPGASSSSAFRNGDPASLGLSRVGSATLVYSSPSRAEQSMTYLASPRFAECLGRSLEEESGHTFSKSEKATLAAEPVTQLPRPTAGEESLA